MKNADKLPGVSEILLPSERGNRVAQHHSDSGMLPIESNLYKNLKVMASKADAPTSAAAASNTNGTGSSSGSGPHTAGGVGGLKLETALLHPAPGSVVDPFDASGPPLYQTATFGQPGATDCGQFDYTRSGNPTRTMLEEQVGWGLVGWLVGHGREGALLCVGVCVWVATRSLGRTGALVRSVAHVPFVCVTQAAIDTHTH